MSTTTPPTADAWFAKRVGHNSNDGIMSLPDARVKIPKAANPAANDHLGPARALGA